MRIIDFPGGSGRSIDRFGSTHARMLGGVRFSGDGGWVFFEIGAGGMIGRHPAVLDQLFVVLDGSGWVAGGDETREPINAGQAAFWTTGEEHGSGSETGMRVAILEASMISLPE